jgi:hypothetical protein
MTQATNTIAPAVLNYPLSRFLIDIATPLGTSWRTEIAKLISDPIEFATITTLGQQLAADGAFLEPVVVDTQTGVIQNGMHRVTAAVLAGASTITVTDEFICDYSEIIEAVFTLQADSPTEDEVDDVCAIIRSFQCTDHWVTTDVISVRASHHFSTAYYCHSEHANSLADDLMARTASYGYVITRPTVTAYDLDD